MSSSASVWSDKAFEVTSDRSCGQVNVLKSKCSSSIYGYIRNGAIVQTYTSVGSVYL